MRSPWISRTTRNLEAVNKLRAGVLLTGFVLSALGLIPFQMAVMRLAPRLSRLVPHYYNRFLCRWLGIRISVTGQPASDHSVLFLSNHTSYFDILAISATAPVSFIAKSEVASWPFFGILAKLHGTVFVDRQRRSRTAQSRDEMAERLRAGDNLVLFPEGTSNDGNRVLGFKSALIGVAQSAALGHDTQILVQPVSIVYARVHGVPMGRQYRPNFAWYGDMELLDHLWDALVLGPVNVEIQFHDALEPASLVDRKKVASHCQAVIGQGVAQALAASHRD